MRGDRVEIVIDAGGEVRTARFMASRSLALVEHPAADQDIAREVMDARGNGTARRRRLRLILA